MTELQEGWRKLLLVPSSAGLCCMSVIPTLTVHLYCEEAWPPEQALTVCVLVGGLHPAEGLGQEESPQGMSLVFPRPQDVNEPTLLPSHTGCLPGEGPLTGLGGALSKEPAAWPWGVGEWGRWLLSLVRPRGTWLVELAGQHVRCPL